MDLRRLMLILAFIVLTPAASAAGSDRGSVGGGGPDRVYLFDVYGDGTHLGEHRVTIRREGSRTIVDVRIELRWRLAYVTFFRYEHRNHLVWEADRLVAMESTTNDNGTHQSVSVRRGDAGLLVTVGGTTESVPEDILPTTYWRPETVERTRMLDTQAGRVVDFAVQQGEERRLAIGNNTLGADTYILTGDLTARLWYTADGDWVGMRFTYDGTEIDYRRRSTDAPR